MTIANIIEYLENTAPLAYQEDYDNCGLITGNAATNCTGVLISLDATEAVVKEAIEKNCNLVISHHPIIFRGLKKITGQDYVEKTVIKAIRHNIALYAIHTNLDNVQQGVNGKMADVLELVNRTTLSSKAGTLKKLYTYVPVNKAEEVRNAIFLSGGGQIGNYSECSFNSEGTGTFKAGEGTDPYVGKLAERHLEKEMKIEVIFPGFMENRIVRSMIAAHPYEEVAYEVIELANTHPGIGSGLVGELKNPVSETAFLQYLKERFKLAVIRHTALKGEPVRKVALCGGAGSFLIKRALAERADFFISADFKYHEFFDANDRMVIADIGHFESEQFTIDLIHEILNRKLSNFALLKTEVNTNPVNYFLS